MRFVPFSEVVDRFRGKSVAVVGSAPSVLDNKAGFVDSHDVVVRVNNYKTSIFAGYRCDVFYSFFGGSIRNSVESLIGDGVKLCMCKCPDSKPIQSDWHEQNGKQIGIDYTYIYAMRRNWWFCDTYIPTDARFVELFRLLDRHIPSTGFSAILEVLACEPRSLYLTGFDFFSSGVHNVNEPWRPGNPADPIGHRPDLEAGWLAANRSRYPLMLDAKLNKMMAEPARVV